MALHSPDGHDAPAALTAALVRAERECAVAGRPVCATWLNHYSIRLVLARATDALARVDVCGVDGQFLRLLLRHPVRTSADLVVPLLLREDDGITTVLAIGGHGDRTEGLAKALTEVAERPVDVVHVDGFEGLPRGKDLARLVRAVQPDLVLVGLGAGLQEQVVVEAAGAMSRGYALTCGGFLDQVLQPGYYPSWAYPLKLNWMVRLAREPRRLWRRYTVEALLALPRSFRWRRALRSIDGVAAHARMCHLAPVREQWGRPLRPARPRNLREPQAGWDRAVAGESRRTG